jgi:hypothetical protein
LEPCLANWSAVSCPSICMFPGIIPVGSCYILPVAPRIDDAARHK